MLELRKSTQIAEIAFVSNCHNEKGQQYDILGYVQKHEGQPWELEYRFRYYKDDKIKNSEDEKKWYQTKNINENDGPEKLVVKLSFIANLAAKIDNGKIDRIPVYSDGLAAFELLKNRSWFRLTHTSVGNNSKFGSN